jgi:hypothetical protein
LTPGAEYFATGVSLMALTERVHSDGATPPERNIFLLMQKRLDELTQPGWGVAANYCCEREMKYATAKLKVPAVVKPQIDMTAGTASSTTAGKHLHTLDIVRGQSEMRAVTAQPGCSQMRPGSEKPQSNTFILVLSPDPASDLIPIQN